MSVKVGPIKTKERVGCMHCTRDAPKPVFEVRARGTTTYSCNEHLHLHVTEAL